MSHYLVFALLAFSSVASANEWSVKIFEGSTEGVSFRDVHGLDSTRITNCDLLIECEPATVAAPAVVKAKAPVAGPPASMVIYRGVVKTEEAYVSMLQCTSVIQGRLVVRYLSSVTKRYYADASACETAGE